MYCTFLILELKHSFLPIYSIHVYMQISSNAPSSLIYSIKNDYGAIPNGFVETCMIC